MILVDTNVWSELLKPLRNEPVLEWLNRHSDTLVMSSIVLAELRLFVAKQDDGRRKREMQDVVSTMLAGIGERFVAFGEAEAVAYAELMARLRRAGTPIPLIDGWIAAQAIANALPIATRNTPDFQHTGIVLVNPWKASPPPSSDLKMPPPAR